ncbi:hypothetical protein DPSP01_002971 [Paraphaeosphaeria sporulosa]
MIHNPTYRERVNTVRLHTQGISYRAPTITNILNVLWLSLRTASSGTVTSLAQAHRTSETRTVPHATHPQTPPSLTKPYINPDRCFDLPSPAPSPQCPVHRILSPSSSSLLPPKPHPP